MRPFTFSLLTIGVIIASCTHANLNIDAGLGSRWPVVGSITVPSEVSADGKWHFSVSFSSGQAPYTVTWNFSGGANPDTVGPRAAMSPDKQAVDFTSIGGTYTVTVNVTDALGQSGMGSTTYDQRPGGTVNPLPPPPPPPNLYEPKLEVISGEWTDTLTVRVEDKDHGKVTVAVQPPEGMVCNPESDTLAGGSGYVTFAFSSDDVSADQRGLAVVTASDGKAGHGVSVEANVWLKIRHGDDALLAVPQQETAAEGETVTIVVSCTRMNTPFQFMNGCRVTSNAGFEYVANTFNVGSVGGAAGDTDGIWSSVNPEMFLLVPDKFIVGTYLKDGRTAVDFNLTPIGGHDITNGSGDIFNFGAHFAKGLNIIGFQDFLGVSRTYYTDSNGYPNNYWSDTSNDHAGVPNSVEVN